MLLSNLSRLTIGFTSADGTRVKKQYANNGRGALVETCDRDAATRKTIAAHRAAAIERAYQRDLQNIRRAAATPESPGASSK
jgi:hypothetical protein